MLHLHLTGRPTLVTDDGRTPALPRKAFVLAAHFTVATTGGQMTRRQAAEILWDDADPSRRAGNLRQLLFRLADLQKSASFTLFDFDAESIRLNSPGVEIDAVRLMRENFSAAGRRVLDLCTIYRGDLLLGIEEGGEAHRHWLSAARARLRLRFASLLTAELENAQPDLSPDESLVAAQRLLGADPQSEVAFRVILRTHFATGDMRAVDRWRRRLDLMLRDVGRTPEAGTLALLAEIRARRESHRTAVDEIFEAPFDPTVRPGAGTPASVHPRSPRIAIDRPDARGLPEDVRGRLEGLFDAVASHLRASRTFELIRPPEGAAGTTPDEGTTSRKSPDYTLGGRPIVRASEPGYLVELLHQDDGEILWLHEVDYRALETHTAHEIAQTTIDHIERSELRRLFSDPEQPTTYRSTLHAQRLLREIDLRSIRRARRVLRTALTIDPTYAPALAAVAKSFRLEWLRLARGDGEELDMSLAFARRAVAAGPDSGYGEHQLGMTSIYRKDYDFGLVELAKAEHFRPYDEELTADHADGLILAGHAEKGLDKLTPLLGAPHTVTDHTLWIAASGLYLVGRYADAIALLSRQSAADSGGHLRAACHAMLSEFEEARHWVEKTRDMLPDFTIEARLRMVPIRRKEDLDHYREGLRRAGFD